MEVFLKSNGRIRLIYPVYRGLVNNGEDAELARGLFEAARPQYHPLTVTVLVRLFTPTDQ